MAPETPARAQALVRTIRDVLHPVELLLRQHPYVQALEEGRLLPSQLRSFVGEQSSIIPSDLRSIALLISRGAAPASQQFFRAVLDGEAAALEALGLLATAVGMAPLPTATPMSPPLEHRLTAPILPGSASMGVRPKSPRHYP